MPGFAHTCLLPPGRMRDACARQRGIWALALARNAGAGIACGRRAHADAVHGGQMRLLLPLGTHLMLAGNWLFAARRSIPTVCMRGVAQLPMSEVLVNILTSLSA